MESVENLLGTKLIFDISVYPAKGQPGSRSTKLDSGAEKRLRRSPIEGFGPRPQASARLTRAAVVPQAIAQSSVRRQWGLSQRGQFCTVFPKFYTLSVEIFRMFFFRSRLPITPMNREKFHGYRSTRFLEIRNTDRQTWQLYIYTLLLFWWRLSGGVCPKSARDIFPFYKSEFVPLPRHIFCFVQLLYSIF